MNTKLITKAQREVMLKNGQKQREAQQRGDCLDLEPVVKLFTPDAQCTWLLVALYPNDTNVAFGLCDLGMGIPEIGDVRISNIEKMRGQLNLPVERDRGFLAEKTLTEYSKDARIAQRITA
jgi:Protein of unknown function (DUF2958)